MIIVCLFVLCISAHSSQICEHYLAGCDDCLSVCFFCVCLLILLSSFLKLAFHGSVWHVCGFIHGSTPPDSCCLCFCPFVSHIAALLPKMGFYSYGPIGALPFAKDGTFQLCPHWCSIAKDGILWLWTHNCCTTAKDEILLLCDPHCRIIAKNGILWVVSMAALRLAKMGFSGCVHIVALLPKMGFSGCVNIAALLPKMGFFSFVHIEALLPKMMGYSDYVHIVAWVPKMGFSLVVSTTAA